MGEDVGAERAGIDLAVLAESQPTVKDDGQADQAAGEQRDHHGFPVDNVFDHGVGMLEAGWLLRNGMIFMAWDGAILRRGKRSGFSVAMTNSPLVGL